MKTGINIKCGDDPAGYAREYRRLRRCRAKAKAYRQAHKAEARETWKVYQKRNKEQLKAYQAAYYLKHRERLRAYKKAHKQRRGGGGAVKTGLQATEHGEQAAFVKWCKLMEPQIPELALLFAIPNGGFRHWKTAAYLKAEGVKAGVPDLFLPVCVSYEERGLFIEMKRPGGPKPTKEQSWWHERLRKGEFEVEVCYGFEEAKTAILRYLGKEDAL